MTTTRKYEMRDRARQQEQTRQRIVDALVELHETVGAAHTTVREVARRAGVGRMTVYNHFPTEAEMVEACTSHWISQHPPPDADRWRTIEDPVHRVREALAELYAYYRETQAMWSTAYRDQGVVEPLGRVMEATWLAFLDAAVEALLAGRGLRGGRLDRARAALRLAVDFPTWQALTSSGLEDGEAAAIAATFADTVASSR